MLYRRGINTSEISHPKELPRRTVQIAGTDPGSVYVRFESDFNGSGNRRSQIL